MKPISSFLRPVRKKIRNLSLQFGYRIDCVRHVPWQLLDPARRAVLEFDHAVCRRMVEVRRPLHFVQVGAFDGITRDPIFPYIRDHDWRGILIEPQPRACELLRSLHSNNPRIHVVNAAVAADRGMSDLYMVEGTSLPEWCGGLASFSRDVILKHKALVPGIEDFIVSDRVQTLPFDEILGSLGYRDFDLLQIDAEGGDAEILRLFPFSSIRPAIVHWEIKHLSGEERQGCFDLLSPQGYRFAMSGEEDMLAILT